MKRIYTINYLTNYISSPSRVSWFYNKMTHVLLLLNQTGIDLLVFVGHLNQSLY